MSSLPAENPAGAAAPLAADTPPPVLEYHLIVAPHRRPLLHLRYASLAELAAEVARFATERTYGDAAQAVAFRGEEIPLSVTPVRRVAVGEREISVATAAPVAGWLTLSPAQDG